MLYYYTSVSVFLYKNMTVVLLLHPKTNCMTIPRVVPVNNFKTIPLCSNFSNRISRTFLNHSSRWFKFYFNFALIYAGERWTIRCQVMKY